MISSSCRLAANRERRAEFVVDQLRRMDAEMVTGRTDVAACRELRSRKTLEDEFSMKKESFAVVLGLIRGGWFGTAEDLIATAAYLDGDRPN